MEKGLQGKETRSRLLSVATREFAARGFNDTKVDTIVREAQLSKPALYIYFDSKQAIFDEIVNHGSLMLKGEVRKIGLTWIGKGDLSSERIKNVLEKFLAFLLGNRDLMVVTIILNKNFEELIDDLTVIVKENLIIEADINYIKTVFAHDIFADILVTNVLMLSKKYLLTGKSSPQELASILSLLLTESILK